MVDTDRTPDHRDVTLRSMDDYGQQLERALSGLSIEEAHWMPTPESNHILWIIWHMDRMKDLWAWYLRGDGRVRGPRVVGLNALGSTLNEMELAIR